MCILRMQEARRMSTNTRIYSDEIALDVHLYKYYKPSLH